MKGLKLSACALSAAMLLSGCSMSNTAKGGLIGGGGGGALGALIGHLAGGGKGAAIGAAIGTTLGAGAGVLIGNKMDKAKKAAEAANAQAEILTDSQGMQYVKATFDSGLMFETGKSALSVGAKKDLTTFASGLDANYDLCIAGFTDNTPWRGSTAEQSIQKNLTLSRDRAKAVESYLLANGITQAQMREVVGYGEDNPVADNSTAAGKQKNRRVEVYILPSKQLIDAANKQAQ